MMTGFTILPLFQSKQIRDHHLCLKAMEHHSKLKEGKEPIGFLLKPRTGVLGQDAKETI